MERQPNSRRETQEIDLNPERREDSPKHLPDVIEAHRKEELERRLNNLVGNKVTKVVVGPFEMVSIEFENGQILSVGSKDIEVL